MWIIKIVEQKWNELLKMENLNMQHGQMLEQSLNNDIHHILGREVHCVLTTMEK